MLEAEVTNETCEKCGVDVRENTAFCYNCGSPVTDEAAGKSQPQMAVNGATSVNDAEGRAALDDLAERFKIDDSGDDDNKLAKAAAERRKMRTRQRKPDEFVWEPAEDSSSRVVVLLALLIAAVAAGAVFLTVYWK